MLTPPHHFSVAASPYLLGSDDGAQEQLYRGSIPAERNLPFLQRLKLKTIVYLRKKALKPDDGLVQWASNGRVQLRWVKADAMSEEALGIGRNEVVEVLKLILDPTLYPLYIADLDGISHTTLVIACLRKLQGWHMSSIIDEIARFEPDHEDLPLVPFVQSFLAPGHSAQADNAMQLPSPPYPSWLWPQVAEQHVPLERIKSAGSNKDHPSRSSSGLPFAHPLAARRHPSLRLIFPSGSLAAPATYSTSPNSLSRVNTLSASPSSHAVDEGPHSLIGAATSLLTSGMSTLTQVMSSTSDLTRTQRNVGFSRHGTTASSDSRSPQNITRETTRTSSIAAPSTDSSAVDEEEIEDGDDYDDDEDEDDGDVDDEDEEEEDEAASVPTSQYISALDLAGFG